MRKENAPTSLTARAGYLLRQAMTVLDMDRQVARRYLSDAATLLGAELVEPDPGTPLKGYSFRSGGLARWQARRALEHIHTHLGSKLAVGELATLVGLSESHFSRAFRYALGCSPMAYVTVSRLERAKRMMTSTAQSLSNIALACGFADQSHFNRSFRRWVGMSPGAWRRNSDPLATD
jgi:AraC-like DNA-binding protein